METTKLYLLLSTFVIIFKFVFKRNDPWNIVIFFYFFFSFGTIINFIIGNTIYFGINKDYIPFASKIFFYAILSSTITSLLFNFKNYQKEKLKINFSETKTIIPLVIILIIYALTQSLNLLRHTHLDKVQRVSLLNPSLHYPYLLLQTYLLAFYYLLKPKSFLSKLYYINGFFYITYCLLSGERDFIFPISSIFIHNLVLYRSSIKKKFLYLVSMFGLVASGIIIFLVRDETQSFKTSISAILNQGSILFINTNILKYLNSNIEHFNGSTYINSIINLLPSWIYKTDFNTINWFKNLYAKNSTSGYGFAIDAEGYLNFGIIGVVATFFIITIVHRISFNNIKRHPIFIYFSTFYLSFVMYSLRNDSLAYLKGSLYAILFFIFLTFSSYLINLLTGNKKIEN